jgi:hypothetical protein
MSSLEIARMMGNASRSRSIERWCGRVAHRVLAPLALGAAPLVAQPVTLPTVRAGGPLQEERLFFRR